MTYLSSDDKKLRVFELTAPFGEGVATSFDSALLRPFKKILTTGKPVGKICHVYYMESGRYFVLGCFCRTGKRLLFYPTGQRGQLVFENYPNHPVDHFSLEDSLRNWHVTFNDEKFKIPVFRTRRKKENLFLWFVLTARSIADFELAPRKILVPFLRTEKEGTRMAKELMKSRDGVTFNACHSIGEFEPPFVFNFEIYVSTDGSLPEDPVHVNIPDGYRGLEVGGHPLRNHKLHIPGYAPTIHVRASKIRGSQGTPWRCGIGSLKTAI